MAQRMDLEVLEADLFHLVIGGVVFQPVTVAAVAVALFELRRIAVDDARQAVEFATGRLAKLFQPGFEVGKQFGFGIDLQRSLEAGVNVVEIEVRAVRRDMAVIGGVVSARNAAFGDGAWTVLGVFVCHGGFSRWLRRY